MSPSRARRSLAATSAARLAARLAALAPLALAASAARAQTLRVRNNHELPYAGPVEARVGLPDGVYAGDGATGEVRGGVARALVSLGARGTPRADVRLARTGPLGGPTFRAAPLALTPVNGRLALAWGGRPLGFLDVDLVVLPGATATVDSAVLAFRPEAIPWAEQPDGTWRADVRDSGYRVELTLAPYGAASGVSASGDSASGGWLDARARVTRVDEAAGKAYVALVRRVHTPGAGAPRLRFNGRVLDVADSPPTWDRDFWYTHGVDWTGWTAGALSLVAVNGFTPTPTIENAKGEWVEGSHFYVWERTRRAGDATYLVSEIAGPNPDQARSRYMPVTEYAPVRRGDALELRWRLALSPARTARGGGVARDTSTAWEESQLRAFAGYRLAERDSTRDPARASARDAARDSATVDVGVRAVTFGTAYLPYSTFVENLDYYRVPGVDRETWWPVSPTQWRQWRRYVPRMRTDLHIIRAMGFDVVRLHHLELLQKLDRRDALAFLDFYAGEARALGLRMMLDSEGPPEWVTLVAGRYRDLVSRVEIENEVLIAGVKPGTPERWTALYRAVKAGNPAADAFLTTAGNHGQFERLRALGVPFDRVGLHAYKHGAGWEEAYRSHALGTGGYASDIGMPSTLGEFNWKDITRLSPEARGREAASIFESTLEPRAIPEVFEFQFHEMLAVSPSLSLNAGRHYEVVGLDRRPKPEAATWTRLIREYGAEDAPVRALPVEVGEARLVGGAATAPFTVTNRGPRPVVVDLSAVAFDGTRPRLLGPARVTLAPGASHAGRVALRLAPGARPGTYHHFVRAAYGGRASWGWGVASNPGAPRFAPAPVLGARVAYPQGADVVRRVDWARPLAVAYGEKASVLEVEMAFLLASTLQAATGRPVRVSGVADVPDSLARAGTLLLVGTAATNSLVARAGVAPPAPAVVDGTGKPRARGVVALHDAGGGRRWLVLTGADRDAVQAAASDVVLRFWPHAKDAAMRLAGMERGNLLGNRAGVTEADPPED